MFSHRKTLSSLLPNVLCVYNYFHFYLHLYPFKKYIWSLFYVIYDLQVLNYAFLKSFSSYKAFPSRLSSAFSTILIFLKLFFIYSAKNLFNCSIFPPKIISTISTNLLDSNFLQIIETNSVEFEQNKDSSIRILVRSGRNLPKFFYFLVIKPIHFQTTRFAQLKTEKQRKSIRKLDWNSHKMLDIVVDNKKPRRYFC